MQNLEAASTRPAFRIPESDIALSSHIASLLRRALEAAMVMSEAVATCTSLSIRQRSLVSW